MMTQTLSLVSAATSLIAINLKEMDDLLKKDSDS